jgi:hypothetical protein
MAYHLTADLEANYERFVSRVRSSETLWGLRHKEGWAICPSNERDCDLYVFWSEEAYARQHCKDEWSGYEPASITLQSFLDNWIPGMEGDGFLVGVQFNSDLAGLEVEPSKLALDLSK